MTVNELELKTRITEEKEVASIICIQKKETQTIELITTGPQGAKGEKGDPGKDGSDADVTPIPTYQIDNLF